MEVTQQLKTYRIPKVKLSYVSDGIANKPKIISSIDTTNHFRNDYEPGMIEYRESFKVMYLNRANKIIGICTISEGGTDATVVDKKIVFTGALLANASSIIVCHNHPSGNILPSFQDDKLTKEIKSGCDTLGLKLLDHIILTHDNSYSYADNCRL